jgi:hypothetical protein
MIDNRNRFAGQQYPPMTEPGAGCQDEYDTHHPCRATSLFRDINNANRTCQSSAFSAIYGRGAILLACSRGVG